MREFRTPGSARGTPGNRRSYLNLLKMKCLERSQTQLRRHCFAFVVVAFSSCDQSSKSATAAGSGSTPENFVLSQARKVATGAIWDREINGSRPGTLKITVKGPAPFTVTLVDDSVYQLMVKEGKSAQDFESGIHINSASDAESFQTTFKLDKGKYWISISNNTSDAATYQLECHSW